MIPIIAKCLVVLRFGSDSTGGVCIISNLNLVFTSTSTPHSAHPRSFLIKKWYVHVVARLHDHSIALQETSKAPVKLAKVIKVRAIGAHRLCPLSPPLFSP